MATIKAENNEKMFQLKAFLGLNQNPDGDTKLKLGEAAAMVNFKITRDGNLQKRSGTKTLIALGAEPVRGLWSGFVNGEEVFLAACSDKLWRLYVDGEDCQAVELGGIDTDNEVHFFGFSGIVYMLNGTQFKQWDGVSLEDVEGYRPLVVISSPPNGGGELLEQVNKLCGKRRMWLSPDGEGTLFRLPEKGLVSIDYVTDLKTGQTVDSSLYSFDLTEGTLSFNEAPPQSANSFEIGWTMGETYRHQVSAMRYSELYSGTQDTRVFIYGDGSNKCFYSGIDYWGKPRADYFPDQNEVMVGDANTPITALIRHYSTLICYKSGSSWAIQYGLISMADGLQTAAFYVTPVNRTLGNEALGQVRLVLNAPYALCGNELYEYRNNASYSSNLSVDERQAKRISDKIHATLKDFDFAECYCFDDNLNQEYYICYGGRALVCNYAVDAWYFYDRFDVGVMCSMGGELYIGSTDGKLKRLAYRYLNDDGEAVVAYWESGSMSFNQDYMRKYAAQLWVSIKPEVNAELHVTVQTDRKSNYTEKLVESSLATFGKANFARWSFKVNRKPQMKRLKIKAKKFVYYKLIFKTTEPDVMATVLGADIRVRYTGYAK